MINPSVMTVTDKTAILTQSAKFLKGDGINRTPIDSWALPVARGDSDADCRAELLIPFQQLIEELGLVAPARIDAFVPRDFFLRWFR